MTTNNANLGWAPHDPEATIRADMATLTGAAPTPPTAPSPPTAPAPAAPAQPTYQPQAPLLAPAMGQPEQFGQPVWNGAQSRPLAPVTNSSAVKVAATSVLRSLLMRAVSFAVVAAIGLGGYYFFVVRKNAATVKAALPANGSCFSWNDSTGATVLPCASPQATYKTESTSMIVDVTAAKTACDTVGAYSNFQVTAQRRNNSKTGTICGALNVKVGDCVDQSGDAMVIPCTAARGDDDTKVLSITRVATGLASTQDSAASTACSNDSTAYLSDYVAASVVCLGKP